MQDSIGLAPELVELITSRFSSLEQIDVFVLLFEHRERQWTPAEVADALGIAPQSAGMRLFLLASAGLLTATGDRDVRYAYASGPALDTVAPRIQELHRTDRQTLGVLFGGASPDPARQFADSFRLRKR